jgi:hypothetical protein
MGPTATNISGRARPSVASAPRTRSPIFDREALRAPAQPAALNLNIRTQQHSLNPEVVALYSMYPEVRESRAPVFLSRRRRTLLTQQELEP